MEGSGTGRRGRPERKRRKCVPGKTTAGTSLAAAMRCFLVVCWVVQLLQLHISEAAADVVEQPPPQQQPPPDLLYDVVVLGSGPAGLTAALFAARAGLSVLVLGSHAGSSLAEASQLDNYPGFDDSIFAENNQQHSQDKNEEEEEELGGSVWLKQTKQKAIRAGATFAQAGLLASNLQVSTLTNTPDNQDSGRIFQIGVTVPNDNLHVIQGRSVILAMGATAQTLGLPFEHDLWARSIHSCAVCDGASYRNQTVVVVGGGDAAVDAALLLARYAKRVIVVHRRLEFRASNQRHVELLVSTPNIQVMTPYIVQEYQVTTTPLSNENNENDGAATTTKTTKPQITLTGVKLEHAETKQEQTVHCDGVFILIGSKPNTAWLQQQQAGSSLIGVDIALNSNGFVVLVDHQNPNHSFSKATSVPGIFVAGEATDQVYRQAITAAAEGAQAAMDAERWLRTTVSYKGTTQQQQPQQPQQPAIPLETIPDESANRQGLRRRNNNDQATTASGEQQRKTQETPGQQQQPPQQPKEPPAITCDVAQPECLDHVVHQHPLVIFSKPRCPQCQSLMETLALEGLSADHPNVNVINVSKMGTTKAKKIRDTLKIMTGRKQFPSVFLDGQWIAGEAQIRIWHNEGKLREMFLQAKVYNVDETTTGGSAANTNDVQDEEL